MLLVWLVGGVIVGYALGKFFIRFALYKRGGDVEDGGPVLDEGLTKICIIICFLGLLACLGKLAFCEWADDADDNPRTEQIAPVTP